MMRNVAARTEKLRTDGNQRGIDSFERDEALKEQIQKIDEMLNGGTGTPDAEVLDRLKAIGNYTSHTESMAGQTLGTVQQIDNSVWKMKNDVALARSYGEENFKLSNIINNNLSSISKKANDAKKAANGAKNAAKAVKTSVDKLVAPLNETRLAAIDAKNSAAHNTGLLEGLEDAFQSGSQAITNSIEALSQAMSAESKKALGESELQTSLLTDIKEGLSTISGGSSTIDTDALGQSIGKAINDGIGDSLGDAIGKGIGSGLEGLNGSIGDLSDGMDGVKSLLAGTGLDSVGAHPAPLLDFSAEYLVNSEDFQNVQDDIDALNIKADVQISEFKRLMNFDTSMLNDGTYKEHTLNLWLNGKETSLKSGVLPALVDNASLIYSVIMLIAVLGGIRMLGKN
ncbi:hypothetical protein QWY97_18660 [Vibrio cortegadensis]|uniref:hypothetical protein n=1 Tax=Vibrio cortegadensis TaxID=1328770 RepID=UPI0021C2E73A|nr:hypothetical protein [Vibrio cortegadensis]MDN3699344.1 hypothetical protein [Vibrio cortegadensis]